MAFTRKCRASPASPEFKQQVPAWLVAAPVAEALRPTHGMSPITAMTMLAELDITLFGSPRQLMAYPGLGGKPEPIFRGPARQAPYTVALATQAP
ncbi:transposase [Halomonas sp. KAO]|uniref:transposase n=1 Tax=unclassified Halomonas TaxID=2609666 RepID=UPI0018A0A406|nr:transposase [Halomonas sp. KAO]